MDEQLKVKKKRSWVLRTAIWVVSTVAVLTVGVIAAATLYQLHEERVARTTAALPVRERNLAIFDAACEVLEDHYYDPSVFKSEKWRKYKAWWREQAAASGPGPLLYSNVLANFGSGFLDSHVSFEAPENPDSPAPPPTPTRAKQVKPPSPEQLAAWKQRVAIFMSGPGFDPVMIRRGNLTTQIVGDVIRGSAAERAGIAPGWGAPGYSTNLNKNGVHLSGTFLELTADEAREFERLGHPPGAEIVGSSDPFTIAHSAKHEFELDLTPAVAPFESRRFANGVTYLRFDTFADSDLLDRLFESIDKAGPEGLVIDLRRNGGGVSWYLERFLGRLLGNDVVIGTLRDRDSTSSMHTWRWGSSYKGPVVMLIGPRTTSAAEIAAAAMQDLKRGKLVGRMTNGSVLSSKKHSLPDGGLMMVPQKNYFRAGNRRIEGAGVEPDIWVLPTLEDVRAGRDPVLDRALQELASSSKR